jgi:NAD(P)-dependent dehydrogenase (short-subunit alcohol dehydrogenase family)
VSRTRRDLADLTAVVTGAGSGIGLAAVDLLAGAGATVVGVDRNPNGEGDVVAAGGRFVLGDVSRRADWTRIAAEAAGAGPPLRLAFLNAGVHLSEPDPLAVSDDAFDRIVGVNVRGVLLGMQALAPVMEGSGGGDVVVNASVGGLMAYRADPVYAMTKHAVIGLVRSSTKALAGRDVRLHTLCPGVVDTPILPEHIRADVEAAGLKPLAPAEVAACVVDLWEGDRSGGIWVIQPGVPLTEYRYAAIPGL